jgi:glutamate-1-semialdehyde aminotransferase/malonyl CoA-acyl carrier protein transacylase
LAAFLTGRAERDLADIAHTLQSGRKRFVERAMTVALSHTEAAGALAGGSAERHTLTVPGSPVAFMFPGQGAQHAGMGKRLYGGQPWFREEVDRCAEILLPIMGRDLREILFADGADSGKALRRPDLSQPALFTIEYALAVLWRRWGVEPQAMVGHDVGEFVAAVLAEVMTLEDALRLVAARGRLLQDLPAGSMMAVSMPLVDLEDRLASHPALAVSAENANDSCVVSGPTPEIERLFQELKRDQIGCRTLLASHAFHSAMVDPALEPLAEIVGQIELRPPRIPIVSTATGIWLTDEQATDPGYWTGHMRTPIRFGAAIGTLVAGGPHLCLEVGPRATLTAFANRQLAGSDRSSVIASLSDRTKDENRDLLTAAGRLWLHGIELDWESLRHHAPVRRRRLPTYPFERERHWIEPAPSAQDPTAEGPQGPFESPISEDQPAPIVSSEQSQSQAEQGLVLLEKSLLRASSTATVGTGERRRETPTATDLLAGNPLPGMAGINLPTVEMSDKQRARLEAFTRRYGSRTAGSRDLTQANRPHLAHPYAVGGFDPVLKELAYPIVIGRSLGSRVWDVDGNEYIDVVNGFGSCFLGWQSPPVVKAVQRQIKEGFEVATIHPLAGEVARLLCDVTGFDRAGFCNTGSEAVLDAIRLARAVTGRSLIAIFAGSDHGIFDAFVAAGSNVGEPVPAAGENVIVLEYGTPEAIAIIKEHASELAAVLVEPIQKHRPEFRPQEFLHELRELTEQAGIAYIIDEVVTGIRMAPGGAQAILGFKGDIAIYGGPVGGGFPIGIIAGRKAWMDGVDGGDWKYGDDSMPTIANSYLSATAVGQPLALAAAKAVLEHLIDSGSEIQDGVNRLTCDFATRLNAHFGKVEAPLEIQHFGSLWKPAITGDHPYGKLLFPMLRDRGVHILESAPCFFTTAHTEDDVIEVDRAFRDALVEIREAEFLPSAPKRAPQIQASEVDAALSV